MAVEWNVYGMQCILILFEVKQRVTASFTKKSPFINNKSKMWLALTVYTNISLWYIYVLIWFVLNHTSRRLSTKFNNEITIYYYS